MSIFALQFLLRKEKFMKKTFAALISGNPYDTVLATVYFLNLSDYLFTLVLVSSGLFMEANPLLSININGTWGFILKCIVPLVLILYLHIRFSASPPKRDKAVRFLLSLILSYYIVINAFHIFWLCYSVIMFL